MRLGSLGTRCGEDEEAKTAQRFAQTRFASELFFLILPSQLPHPLQNVPGLWTLSHWERSLGLQQARRSMALSASLLNPASSSLSSSRAARWLKSRHSEDWVIFWCIMQRASISPRISFLSTSLWGMVYDKGARGFQYNSYQRLNQIEEMDRIGRWR